MPRSPWLSRSLIALAFAGIASVQLWHALQPAAKPPRFSCPDLSQRCDLRLGAEAVSLSASQPPAILQRFTLTLSGQQQPPQVSFQMTGMNIGPNRFPFHSAGAQRWQAEIVLPFCTQSRNDWILLLSSAAGQAEVQFRSRPAR